MDIGFWGIIRQSLKTGYMKVLPQNYSKTLLHQFQHTCKFQIKTSNQNSRLTIESTHIRRQFLLLFVEDSYFRKISADVQEILTSFQICFPCVQQTLRFPSKQMFDQYFQQIIASFFDVFFIQLFTNRPINLIYIIWALRNLINEVIIIIITIIIFVVLSIASV
jgi:hypothetical protein